MKSKELTDLLTKMKTDLPHGAIEEVRKKRKCSRSFIYQILNGSTALSEKATLILEDFKKIIVKDKEESAKQVAELSKLLGK